MLKQTFSTLATAAITLAVGASSATAASLVNGGFENDFLGWTVVAQPGSNGGVSISTGGTAPLSGYSLPSASEGTKFALTDQNGWGSYVIFQDITLEANSIHSLSFDWFNKSLAPFADAGTLNKDVSPNQQFRVDLVSANFSDWFGTSSSDGVLANIVAPSIGPDTWTSKTFDVTPWAGSTVRLAFREVDNQWFFNAGVDNVQITTSSRSVPEPGTLLGLVGFTALSFSLSRRRKSSSSAGA